jgi:hypothetical protein
MVRRLYAMNMHICRVHICKKTRRGGLRAAHQGLRLTSTTGSGVQGRGAWLGGGLVVAVVCGGAQAADWLELCTGTGASAPHLALRAATAMALLYIKRTHGRDIFIMPRRERFSPPCFVCWAFWVLAGPPAPPPRFGEARTSQPANTTALASGKCAGVCGGVGSEPPPDCVQGRGCRDVPE